MQIPIRAIYSRAPRGAGKDWQPVMTGAAYAEVPEAALMGTLAQCAADNARRAGDDGAAEILDRAIARAAGDGKIQLMD